MKKILALIIIIVAAGAVFFAANQKPVEKADLHTQLLLEVFDSITKNYWNTVDEQKLIQLFSLATSKVASSSPLTASTTRAEFSQYLSDALQAKTGADKKMATLTIAELVLTNLEPFGRSHIYTMQQEKSMRDTVSNIDTSKDLYQTLGVDKTASIDEIKKTADAEVALLTKEKTPESEAKIKELTHIKDTLADEKNKTLYDTQKIEPVFTTKQLSPTTFYLNMNRFSLTSVQEFVDSVAKMAQNSKARELILDMRGNIGGSLDIVPYLSGFFIGPGQTAFELFKQGNYTPFKTPTQKLAELAQFKKVVVLIDGASQSSAELFTSVLKKYNRAVVIGTHSKGWGTIENTFPLTTTLDDANASTTEKYSLFLVHSITIRDDGQPIEGRGVEPDISIDNKNWRESASDLLESKPLVTLLEQVLKTQP